MRRTGMGMTALALAGVLGLSGCGDAELTGRDQARVRVLLTDAPGDLASAEVVIDQVYLQGGTTTGEGERVVLFSERQTFDLLDLRNGVTAELGEVVIPAGSYSQLRMVVSSASITTLDGKTYSTADGSLVCPSCAQSGLKVVLPNGSVRLEAEAEVILIDFDVAQSFGRAAGRSGKWVMRPVIHATEFETTGALTGTVVLGEGVTLPATCGGSAVTLAHFVPQVSFTATGETEPTVLSGTVDANGALRFPFLTPTAFTLGFAESVTFDNGDVLSFTATVDPSTITVTSGQSQAIRYTITGATCTAAGG